MYEKNRIVIILERERISKCMEKYRVLLGCMRNKSSMRYNKYVFAISISSTNYEEKTAPEKEEMKVEVQYSLRKQVKPLHYCNCLI